YPHLPGFRGRPVDSRRAAAVRGEFMMRWMPIRALLAALILLVLGAPRAEGQVCTFTVAEMSFGGESSLPTSQIDATSTITVTCQATIDPGDLRVCLSLPAGSGGNTVLDRRLVNM